MSGIGAKNFEINVVTEREEGVARASADVAAATGGPNAKEFGELLGGAVDVRSDVNEVIGGESGH